MASEPRPRPPLPVIKQLPGKPVFDPTVNPFPVEPKRPPIVHPEKEAVKAVNALFAVGHMPPGTREEFIRRLSEMRTDRDAWSVAIEAERARARALIARQLAAK